MLEAWIKTDRFIHDELQLNPLPSKTKQKQINGQNIKIDLYKGENRNKEPKHRHILLFSNQIRSNNTQYCFVVTLVYFDPIGCVKIITSILKSNIAKCIWL